MRSNPCRHTPNHFSRKGIFSTLLHCQIGLQWRGSIEHDDRKAECWLDARDTRAYPRGENRRERAVVGCHSHRALSTRVLCGWYHAVARCTPVALPPRAEAMRVAAVTGVVRADAGRRRGSSSRCEAVPPQSAPMNSSTRCHAFTCACAATTQRRALAAVSPMGEGQAGRQGGFRRVLPECVFSELGVVGVSHPAHG